jgi:hypothetical protein
MERERIAADDQVLNPVLVQQGEQISEVWLYFHGIGGEGLQPH